ncbi:unnamed protein product [Parascedosporium putredinis]|uniref:Uncharacterized protein n=1 Tax=Parascedosporium putredinis TaxID=1442378 RepID=A0A9P1MB64_9PEZI|nr:unnamed protein product [Parascedosporium putredinis]CAI7995664.1 unnamed protein product [Parascedosporium putredinis]
MQAGVQTDGIAEARRGDRAANFATSGKIRLDGQPKWLVVRQLWLWKLDDDTLLTAIPFRRNEHSSDNLIETIRQGDLGAMENVNDLVKRIVFEAVTFPDEFKWAGLGEHILDIFEEEIALEADKETTFFHTFAHSDSTPRAAANDTIIKDAASSTLLVKDIRSELRLLRNLFTVQLQVVQDLAKEFWPHDDSRYTLGASSTARKALREGFIRDSGLHTLIERVDNLDKDASATLVGLGNIIQAMQAQASLKEAESARLMNLILLPFTIVTVIFTPLSFLTSLFAVNTTNFPTNDDGEVRLTPAYFNLRMVVGELSSLLPLALLILGIYRYQAEARKPTHERSWMFKAMDWVRRLPSRADRLKEEASTV